MKSSKPIFTLQSNLDSSESNVHYPLGDHLIQMAPSASQQPRYASSIAYFYPRSSATPDQLINDFPSFQPPNYHMIPNVARPLDCGFDCESSLPKISNERQCRDTFFLIIFALFFTLLGYLLFDSIVIRRSNPNLLLHGYDNWGNICGQENRPIPEVTQSGQNMFKKPILLLYMEQNSTLNRVCIEYCNPQYFTKTTFNRCLPRQLKLKPIAKTFNATRNVLYNISSDIIVASREIIFLCFLAFIFSLLMLVLMRFVAALIIWVSLVSLTVASLMGTAQLWIQWQLTKESVNQVALNDQRRIELVKNSDKWFLFSLIATILTSLFLLVVLMMRRRIQLVCALIKEAGKALSTMPFLLFLPIITVSCLALVSGLWLIGTLFLMANKIPSVDPRTGFVIYQFDDLYKHIKWFNIFALLWLIYFVTACQHFIIAGSVSKWFFHRDKMNMSNPILKTIFELVRYHLGSIALGSLLVASVKIIRLLFKKVEAFSSRYRESCTSFARIFNGCLWIIEKCLIYINKNAYIVMCKCFVVFLTILAGIEITKEKNSRLNYYWSPLLVAGIFAYFISHCFLAVYEMTIETLFICFCEDCKINEKKPRTHLAHSDLLRFTER